MNFTRLRQLYPVFHYQRFTAETNGQILKITFHYFIEPDIYFSPSLNIPYNPPIDLELIKPFIFHLGLIESLSYWKCTCSPVIKIEAGYLSDDQISWWHELFINGLGEFYYQNRLDFASDNFLTILNTQAAGPVSALPKSNLAGDLILVGGGKDSVVTLDTLSSLSSLKNVLLLNPTPAATATSRIAGFTQPLVITRTLDPKLLELNAAGYLNGHTPFSAYLAFLAVFVAYLHGYAQVIVSNEASAGEGNLNYLGREINHQYSKSFHFEHLFRKYLNRYLIENLQYFSFLRPLSELHIAALFNQIDRYDHAFCSCNVTKNNGWCKHCAKCAFVYLILSSFMSPSRLQGIFGQNLFEIPQIQQFILELTGLSKHKPFDCVGTIDESRQAVFLARDKSNFLQALAAKLPSPPPIDLKHLSTTTHFIPGNYLSLLTNRLALL